MSLLRPWFDGYIAAFNARDPAGFGAYYAQDVQFQGQAAQVTGAQAVLDFYRMVHERLDETLTVKTFVAAAAGDRIAVEMETHLHARRDWPDMPTGAMRAGDERTSIAFILYDIAGGRFTRIRSARFARAA